MPHLLTMSTLETRCRRRVDMANNQARDTTAFRALISEQYGTLCAIVSEVSRYFETVATITADGSSSYDEEASHMHTNRVTRVLSDGREVDLIQLKRGEEGNWKGQTGDATRFTHVDDQIWLYPAPSSGTYKMYYVPQPTDISAYGDSDVVDVCCPAGERFLIWGVAVLVHGELEGNAMLALRERDKYEEELRVWAANQTLTEPLGRWDEDDAPTDPAEFWP